MAKRVVKLRRGQTGRPRKIRLPRVTGEPTSTPSSLPLTADASMPLPASIQDSADGLAISVPKVCQPKADSTWWKAPPNSKIRKAAMKIVAMRIRGFSDADIAVALGLASGQMVRSYLYRAHKNGWMTDELDNPKDKVEYEIGHKLVRNMHEALDSKDPERKDHMTIEVSKMTIAKQFDQAVSAAPPLNVLSIKIEMPVGAPGVMREGTMGGAPAYVEGEAVDVSNGKG